VGILELVGAAVGPDRLQRVHARTRPGGGCERRHARPAGEVDDTRLGIEPRREHLADLRDRRVGRRDQEQAAAVQVGVLAAGDETSAEAGGSNGSLGTSVPGTDHDDIECFLKHPGGVDERHAQSYCRDSERGNNLARSTPEPLIEGGSHQIMAQEIPSGQAMLFIKRDAYERVGLTRAAIDQRLNLTPDEFRVEGALVMIGPLPDDAGLRDLFDELEETGLVYFDDYFELSGNWPAWLRLFVDSR